MRFLVPSLLILMALTWIYLPCGDLPPVGGILYGIKPAVTAIVVFAAYRIGSWALPNRVLWGVAAAAFCASFALDVPFPYIVLGAALIGYLGGRVALERFRAGGATGQRTSFLGLPWSTTTPRHLTGHVLVGALP